MKSKIYLLMVLSFYSVFHIEIYCQSHLEIQGSLQVGNSNNVNPPEGTIRYNTSTKDFEGWNGVQWLSLTRLMENGNGVTDVDGNNYQTIKIGTQEWMAENLRTSKFKNEEGIPNITSGTDWRNLSSGAFCLLDNLSSNNSRYGKLYNWYAVVDSRGLCPDGWHTPSKAEWMVLINHLGDINTIGGMLKEPGLQFWNSPNSGANNQSGFNARASGFREPSGSFANEGISGRWWSSSEFDSMYANQVAVFYNVISILDGSWGKRTGFSVRCIKD